MPLTIDWSEIALRLGLTVLAGGILGLNRSERGMTAGLRTTLLVCLAASISMIQVNLMLTTRGKEVDSFSVLDLMRLPLGILTGMGFIGAGAILRRGGSVRGVTTAATLWLATALGLCFGGGQLGLGLAALVIGMVILWVLKHFEARIPQEKRGSLSMNIGLGGPEDDEIRTLSDERGIKIVSWDVTYKRKGRFVRRQVRCEVHWPSSKSSPQIPELIRQLGVREGIRVLRWKS
jgi:putative Mg2+ transporter-C (MgtC) family protein